jgi:hypothetical protein
MLKSLVLYLGHQINLLGKLVRVVMLLKCIPEIIDHLCGLVVRVPGYTTEMYCASCEVRTKVIYVM